MSTATAGDPVPGDFLGLSFEALTLPKIARYASQGNLPVLMRSLGRGVMRFGGATVDELPDLDRLRDAVTEAGFEVTNEWFATDDSARYEETLAGNAGRHGGPNTLAYAQRIRHRGALPGGTDTLDFAVFVLRA